MLFLIDYENVKQAGIEGYQYLNETDHVILFYSNNAKNMKNRILTGIRNSGCKFEIIKLLKTGKNSLDFYIASECARLLGKGNKDTVVIITKDKGFNAIKDFWAARNIKIHIHPSIETGIKTAGPKDERGERCIFESKAYSIESFYKTYYSTDPLMNSLTALLEGTEHQGDIKDIYNTLRENPQTPKAIYTDILHKFGRTKGLALYRQLKDCKEIQAQAFSYAESN